MKSIERFGGCVLCVCVIDLIRSARTVIGLRANSDEGKRPKHSTLIVESPNNCVTYLCWTLFYYFIEGSKNR